MGPARVWWGLVVATTATGCPGNGNRIGEPCGSPGECRADLQCLHEVCSPLCEDPFDCGDGYTCEADGRCLEVSSQVGDSCSREIDCAPGQACALDAIDNDGDGVLVATCQLDRPGAVSGDLCSQDEDCRDHNCALGRCTQLCATAADCPAGLSCVTIPRPLDNAAPSFQGCFPSSGSLRTTIPMTAPQQTILVPVPSNAISFALTATINDDSQLVGAARVVSPSGDLLYATPHDPDEFYQNPLRHQPTRSISTLLIPNTPLIELEVGAYEMALGSFFVAGNGTAIPHVTVDYKLSPATTLDLNLKFLRLEEHPCIAALDQELDAASAQGTGTFHTVYLAELRRILADGGILVGNITYTDIKNRPDLDGLDLADLPALVKLSDDPEGITIFFVRSVTPAGVLALAGGNPGPPRMAGTAASGVAVSIDTLCYRDWTVVAHATAHEVGRYLGLYRNREPGGVFDDPIPDSSSTPDNLMYFSEDSGGTTLSPGQRTVLQLNPLLR